MSNRLTLYEREKIEFCLKHNQSMRKIAKYIRRDHSVVVREINRNSGVYFGYRASVAQRASERKSKKTNIRKLDKHDKLRDYVIKSLKAGWSPEQIAGRIKNNSPDGLNNITISYEQIYDYIYQRATDNEGKLLYRYLRKKRPIRQPRYSREQRKSTILNKVSIHQRTDDINHKLRYGDWESDSIICLYRRPVSVQYERKSMLVRLNKLANHSAKETNQAIVKSMETLPNYLFKSITFDNGSENSNHQSLGVETYFCDTYSAWQKGGVENINGLIREYLPKKIDLTKITDNRIYQIQELLNNRPRKSLKYQTPNEIIKEQSGALNS